MLSAISHLQPGPSPLYSKYSSPLSSTCSVPTTVGTIPDKTTTSCWIIQKSLIDKNCQVQLVRGCLASELQTSDDATARSRRSIYVLVRCRAEVHLSLDNPAFQHPSPLTSRFFFCFLKKAHSESWASLSRHLPYRPWLPPATPFL